MKVQPRRSDLAALLAASCMLLSCRTNTDLTVAPPAKPSSGVAMTVPASRTDGRLPATVAPLGYDLSLRIDPNRHHFRGTVSIDVALTTPTRAIVLHASELEIERAEIWLDARKIVVEYRARAAAGAPGDAKDEIVLLAPTELPARAVKVVLKFKGPFKEGLKGLYRASEAGENYAITQFEPADARRAFPCFDDPIYKTPFEVSITAPKGMAVFSNAPEESTRDEPGGQWTTHHFARSEPLPTYLVAFVVGKLEAYADPNDSAKPPIRIIAPAGRASRGALSLKVARKQVQAIGDYFGLPYPYAKLDLVSVPNFGAGAMENAGLITFREELLLVPDTAAQRSRRRASQVITHEVAHQWFGNLVTMKWWDDLWLNEGFATYFEAMMSDRLDPETGAMFELLRYTGRVMELDALPNPHAIRKPVANIYEAESAFDGITYIKGAAVLRMIQSWVGDEAFRTGVAAYLRQYQWQNAASDDLFAALSRSSSRDVASVARTFVEQAGVPLVTAKMSCSNSAGPVVTLTQERFRTLIPVVTGGADAGAPADTGAGANAAAKAAEQRWHIPVCVQHADSKGEPAKKCTLLVKRQQELRLDTVGCPKWMLPNAGHDGYYRYAVADDAWAGLADAALKMDTAARVGFLTNLWAQTQAGTVQPSTLFDAALKFAQSSDPETFQTAMMVMASADDALVTPASRPKFRARLGAIVLKHARRLGWRTKPNDSSNDRRLRNDVLTAIAGLELRDRWVAGEVKRRSQEFKDGKTPAPDLGAAIVAMKLSHRAGDIPLDSLITLLREAKSGERRRALIQVLGVARTADDMQKVGELILDGTIRSQDAIYAARASSAYGDSRGLFLEWLASSGEAINAKIEGYAVKPLVGGYRRVCDHKVSGALGAGLRAAFADTPVVAKRLEESEEIVDVCISLRTRASAKADAYLLK